MRSAGPLMLTAALLSACGWNVDKAERNAGSLEAYAASPEGRRQIARSKEAAAKRHPAMTPLAAADRRKRAVEGTWTAQTAVKGINMKVSFSRDGIVVMEEINADGVSVNHAQGTMNASAFGFSGTLTNARKSLMPFAKWTMLPRSGETWAMVGDKATMMLTREGEAR